MMWMSIHIISFSTVAGLLCVPHVTHRQAHRSNPESTSVEKYYRRAVVDHLIDELTCRFDSFTPTPVWSGHKGYPITTPPSLVLHTIYQYTCHHSCMRSSVV